MVKTFIGIKIIKKNIIIILKIIFYIINMKSIKKTLDKLQEEDDDLLMIDFKVEDVSKKEDNVYKFISPDSELFNYIMDCRNKLKHSGIRMLKMLDPSIEILKKDNTELNRDEIFSKRVDFLQGKKINVSNPDNYKMIDNKKFVMILPSNEQLGMIDPYIPIVYINFLSSKQRFLKVILDKNYTTESAWEETY